MMYLSDFIVGTELIQAFNWQIEYIYIYKENKKRKRKKKEERKREEKKLK